MYPTARGNLLHAAGAPLIAEAFQTVPSTPVKEGLGFMRCTRDKYVIEQAGKLLNFICCVHLFLQASFSRLFDWWTTCLSHLDLMDPISYMGMIGAIIKPST